LPKSTFLKLKPAPQAVKTRSSLLEMQVCSRQHRAMNKRISLFLVVAATFLGGCAWFQTTEKNDLGGTWTNPLGTVWSIKADGTFDVDLTHHGKREAWGTWT